MAEPRARVRSKGQVFATSDLTELLYAFGDLPPSLPTTVSCLDEILTDFIIETCHSAALCASYSRRQKIKVDDFRWVLRKNSALLGRISDQLAREKHIREQRKIAAVDELSKEGAADLAAAFADGDGEDGGAGAGAGAGGDGGKKRKGRKKRKAEDEGGAEGGAGGGKRVAS